MNLTLFSININSLFVISPLLISDYLFKNPKSMIILNSRFSYYFSNIIHANTNNFNVILKNNFFSYILNSSISLNKLNEPIKKAEIKKNTVFIQGGLFYVNEYSNINLIITNCNFYDCNSDFGGAIFVEQDCTIILNELIFEKCTAKNGGGCYICQQKNTYYDGTYEFSDESIELFNAQYCCFQDCLTKNSDNSRTGFGSSLLISSNETHLNYISTVKTSEHEQERGAQIDIQFSKNNTNHNINITGGYSKYCGSIEYRKVNECIFKFQTINLIKGYFVVLFRCNSIQAEYCNLISNYLSETVIDILVYPGLFHIVQYDCILENIVFINNSYGTDGRIAVRELQINPDDHTYENQSIKLLNCYIDSYIIKEYAEVFSVESCNFNISSNPFDPYLYLNLGECLGDITPPVFTITMFFTPSKDFTYSQIFSNSNYFTESQKFSQSNCFFTSISCDSTQIEISENEKYLRTLSVSLSQSFLTIKSVIFSYKSYVSHVFTNCYLENEQIQSMCLTEMIYYRYEPYIINYLSPTYIYIPVSIQINFNKKLISSEQLIGIVCGSVSIFFLIVSLIIFIKRKIKSNKYISNSGFSIDESSDQKINESINEYNIDLANTNNNPHEDDTWI